MISDSLKVKVTEIIILTMSFWYGENILFNNSTTDQSKFSLLILLSVHVMCTSMKVF